MSDLHTVHGHIVDLRRHVNVHRRSAFAPTERYELWIRQRNGEERQFTIHTQTMPARRGHEVSLIVAGTEPPQVLGLANWSILDGANYIRTDPPPLSKPADVLAMIGIGVTLMAAWHETGAALSVPAALAYLLVAGLARAMARRRRAVQVDIQMDREARRTSGPVKRLH